MKVRFFAVSLCAALGVLLTADRLAVAEDNEMIVAGTEAPDGKFPYQVRLYSSTDDDRGFCGGSIIAPQWVLTASHCVTSGDLNGGPTSQKDPGDVVVGYGSNDRTKTTKVEVEKIFARPEFGQLWVLDRLVPRADQARRADRRCEASPPRRPGNR